MADDARTEARRRIAEALHAHDCGCPGYVPTSGEADPLAEREIYEGRADAVLDLFDSGEHWCVEGEDEGGPWVMAADDQDEARALAFRHGGTAVASLKLTLPVVPEEPTDA